MKVALRYIKKISEPLHLSKRYILKIEERYKYRNDEFIKYENDESNAPLHLKVPMPTTVYRGNCTGLAYVYLIGKDAVEVWSIPRKKCYKTKFCMYIKKWFPFFYCRRTVKAVTLL